MSDPAGRVRSVRTDVLEIAYEEHGPPGGDPVVLLHGFPYDPRAYDEVVPPLAAEGRRVLVPWLRGYGATRFLSPQTMRSGQQAALGHDLLGLLDALELDAATLVGFDWGGRAASIVAALWPERVRGLVSCASYVKIQDIAASALPVDAEHAVAALVARVAVRPRDLRAQRGVDDRRGRLVRRVVPHAWQHPVVA
jgi:pimeloyl-ACP methyl ester carboxylesterase